MTRRNHFSHTAAFALSALFCAAIGCAPVRAQDSKPASKTEASEKPSQKSVAAKAAFGTIAASDAKVKAASDPKDLTKAGKMTGKTGTFSGTVAQVYAMKGNNMVLLNFDKDYKAAITGVIRAKNFSKFPDLQTLKGKKVLVSGAVEDYKGRPEIQLASLDDIKIIK